MQSNPNAGTTALTQVAPSEHYEATFWQHWRTQLRLVLHKPWLAATWLKQSRTLFQRFNRIYDHLCRQPRPVRRRLQRQMGATLAGAALALALANSPVQAAGITVDGTTCTLADAITAANTDAAAGGCAAGSGADTITLGASATLAAINHTDGASAFGLPPITSTMTIEGAGFTIVRDGGAPTFGFFRVPVTGTLILNNLTLTGSNNPSGAIDNSGGVTVNNSTLSGNTGATKGGAIDNRGLMTLNSSTISGNTATQDGGAIINRGTLTLNSSTLSGNTVLGDDGGAIYNNGGAKLYVNNSTFSGNTANNGGAIYNNTGGLVVVGNSRLISNTTTSTGGAIYNYEGDVRVSDSTLSGNTAANNGGAIANNTNATLTVSNSTFSGNTATQDGGAISNYNSTMTLNNSTLSGNMASQNGGAISNLAGTVTLNNSTLTGNTATNVGGAIYNYDISTVMLNRSLISGNSATNSGPEIYNYSGGTVTAASYNLIGYGGNARSTGFTPSGSDIVPSQALDEILVTTLADNNNPWADAGLASWSHALVSGSPALDAAGTSGLATDQRGVARPQGAADDIGAFEALPFNVTLNGAPCNLIEAIVTANSAARHSSCAAGTPGADTITLTDNITLTAAIGDSGGGLTGFGLPIISTTVTIEGAGFTIARDSGALDQFGLLGVDPTGALTLNDITLTGGAGAAGAILSAGALTINDSTLTGNLGVLSGALLSKYGQTAINGTTVTNNVGIKYGGALFLVSPTTITNSTISNNLGVQTGGGIVSAYAITVTNSLITQNTAKYGSGGGILNLNSGLVTLTGSTLSNNVAHGDNTGGGAGGGLFNISGAVTIIDSTISGNSSDFSGGGLFNYTPPVAAASAAKPVLPAALLEKLQARGIDAAQLKAWAAVAASFKAQTARAARLQAQAADGATMTLINSTVSNNLAGTNTGAGRGNDDDGGGIVNRNGTLILTNSTVSGNQAPNNIEGFHGFAGGIYNTYGGTLTLNNSTVTGNVAGDSGGGIYNTYSAAGMTVVRTIVSGNSAPYCTEIENYSEDGTTTPYTVDGANLFGHSGLTNADAFTCGFASFTPGASDLTATSDGTHPKALSGILNTTLSDNGGATQTHALVAGSPAIEAAGESGLATDQRGVARPQGAADDIGAFESDWANVNSKLALQGSLTTSFTVNPDGTHGAQSPAGVFTINATFRNTAAPAVDLRDVYFQVTTITNTNNIANYLLNADGGPGQVGAPLSIANSAFGVDSLWNQNEDLPATFQIGLMERRRFAFFVDVYGVDATVVAAGADSVQHLGRFQFTFEPDAQAPTQVIFLPVVVRE